MGGWGTIVELLDMKLLFTFVTLLYFRLFYELFVFDILEFLYVMLVIDIGVIICII